MNKQVCCKFLICFSDRSLNVCSENQFKDRITTIVGISKKLWLRRARLEHFLDHILLQGYENDARINDEETYGKSEEIPLFND